MMARSVAGALILLLPGCTCSQQPAPDRPARPVHAAQWPERPRSPIEPQNCSGSRRLSDAVEPLGEGPLRLAALICDNSGHSDGHHGTLVSPDGHLVASLGAGEGSTAMLRVAPVAGREGGRIDTGVGSFLSLTGHPKSPPALAWSDDSRFVWAIRQETRRPRGGWALGPLQPIRVTADGEVAALPALRHRAGPLDGLLWVGGGGRALALFGGRGKYYQPEHADPAPTLAFVDAARGRVLDTLPVHRFHPDTRLGIGVRYAALTLLGDGRISALLDFDDWVVWTQGEPARAMPDPYSGNEDWLKQLAYDGASILVARPLSARGRCDRMGGCRAGPPVEGILAARHDAATGRLIWAIRRRVTTLETYPAPVIGPGGRYALIGLPSEDREHRLALISMRDGAIVQQLPALGSPGSAFGMGFLGPRRIWVRAGQVTAFYDLAPAR
jgi:hypothetical protein